MARLVSWPSGLKFTSLTPLSGPRTIGASSTQGLSGYVQTVSTPFGLWRWQFSFPAMRGQAARRYAGFVTSLHAGANATRVPFNDPDRMSFAEMGTSITAAQETAGMPWSNGKPWSNGMNWACSPPLVSVAAAGTRYSDTITLSAQFWRDKLGVGDRIGFTPFYFGLHIITEVQGSGKFRIWPPLRANITTSHYATLKPVMVMRLESESGASISRGVTTIEPPSITMIEVEDADVRSFFTG